MAEYLIQSETLDDIADAINAKTGGSSAMTPAQMVTAIGSISGGGGSPVEVTIVSGVNNSAITPIKNAITSGSGFTDWIAENKDAAPESGYWLYSGLILPSFSGSFDFIYRRTGTGSRGNSSWTANGTVPAGTKFNVWEVVKNA